MKCLLRFKSSSRIKPANTFLSHSFHTSCIISRGSRWKYALRPDLREFNQQELLESLDHSDPSDQVEFKKQMQENFNWMEGVEDQVAERFSALLANASHKLPKGGIRIGLVDSFLRVLKTPEQLRLAIQCLTVWQHRSKKDKAELTNVQIPVQTSSLVIQAATRINAPDIGLSYIQMPWIDTTITLKMVNTILEKYAEDAENWILYRKIEGKAPLTPLSYRQLEKSTKQDKDEDEDDDEEEEEVQEDLHDEKKVEKLFNHWVDGFMAAYKEARSQKYTWKANDRTYAAVTRFYSSFGDIDAALSITTTFPGCLPHAASSLVLALVHAGRVEEADKIASSVATVDERAKRFLAIAQGKEVPDITPTPENE